MSSNNKTGFELRTDLLGMAIGLLENNREQLVNQFYSKPEKVR